MSKRRSKHTLDERIEGTRLWHNFYFFTVYLTGRRSYRMNRSIQVEETFGVLKEDYHLKKFRTRGTGNVRNELLILAFGYNLNKIHTKIQANRLNLYYHPLKTA